jgi:hypothetical protein
MTQRIHIVASAPRTGTTLLAEMLHAGFEIDGYPTWETSVFERPSQQYSVFCSKNPEDVHVMEPLLQLDPNLWCLHMVRDPRDVVVSRHRSDPEKYWTTLHYWKSRQPAVKKLEGHERFMTVRYEDLVQNPDDVQARIAKRFPFLRQRLPFSEFHRAAQPSDSYHLAMSGLRPVTTNRIGNWRNHKPRLAAQIEIHGSIQADLERLGYEMDDEWMKELEGIDPDNGQSHLPEHGSRRSIRKWSREKAVRYYTR